MRLLLDTHVLIWWLEASPSLGARAALAIESSEADVHVSAATVWEISIKRAARKLEAPADVIEQVDRHRFRALPITFEHAAAAGELPRRHDDPFDRMLIAQSQLEGLTLVTADPRIAAYPVHVLTAA